MRFEGLSSVQTDHRDAMARLIQFRRSHPVLMFGDIRVVPSAPGMLAIERNYFGRSMFAVFNLQDQPAVFVTSQPLNRSFRGQKLQTTAKGFTLNLEPNSYDFLY
jgi:glycosidase